MPKFNHHDSLSGEINHLTKMLIILLKYLLPYKTIIAKIFNLLRSLQ